MGREVETVNPRRAVLFDATGTLIELAEPVGETYARAAARHGAAISAWRLGDAFARVWKSAPPMVFAGADAAAAAERERAAWREVVRQTFLAADSAVHPDDFDACFAELYAHFARGAAWRVRDGARDALRALRGAAFALAVVSNFDRRLHAILADLALAPLLDLVWLPSDAGAAKPDPAIFASAACALGVRPERAVYVGDDALRDLAGARAAGLRAVDVASLATLAALPALLERGPAKEPPR